ncbi:MAG: hypothetical protein LBQ50_11870 [Planctomycetaceae bacterium]|nr:hypothetical protein [Planctomycetaceae bacterium]
MKNNYSGFTLIEIVLVFTAEIFVIGLGVGVLFLVTETRIKEYRRDSVQLAAPRISEQFRADLHTATEAVLENDSLRLSLSNDERLVYSVEQAEFPGQSILRRNKIVNGKVVATENYPLPDHSVTWFLQGKDSYAGLIALNIWTQPVDNRDQILLPIPKKENLNPFTREITEPINMEPRYAGNWRTIIGQLKIEN